MTKYAALLLLFLSSCLSYSDNEEKAMDAILDTWGGTMSSSKMYSTNNQEGTHKTFKVTLSNSPALFEENVSHELIASNAALTIYNAWTKEEREKYTDIACIIEDNVSDSPQTLEFEYQLSLLNDIAKNEKKFNYCVEGYKQYDFKKIIGQFGDELTAEEQARTFARFDSARKKQDSSFGKLNGYKIVGFRFDKENNLIAYKGLLYREKDTSDILVEVYKNRDEKYLNHFLLR